MRLTTTTVTVVIVAILAGLVGAYALRWVLTAPEVEAEVAETPRILVPMTTSNLPPGHVIRMGDVGLYEFTQKQIDERDIQGGFMSSPEQIIGRRVREEIAAGTPYYPLRLYREGEVPPIVVPPGYRTFPVTIEESQGGTIQEGGLVDVVFRAQGREADPEMGLAAIPEQTKVLIEAIKVQHVEPGRVETPLSVGGTGTLDIRLRNQATRYIPPVATLAVTPQQYVILQTVEGRGDIALAPRSSQDALTGTAPEKSLRLEDLLDIPPPPPPPVPPFFTAVYRGPGQRAAVHAFPRDTYAPVPVVTGDEEVVLPKVD